MTPPVRSFLPFVVALGLLVADVFGCSSSPSPGTGGYSSGGNNSSGGSTSSSSGGSASGSSGGSSGGPSSSGGSPGGSSSGSSGDDASTASDGPSGGNSSCAYTDDKQFCTCLGNYTCGATNIKDSSGTNRPVFCGGCATATQYCKAGTADIGLGTCADNPYLKYPWQRQKIDMLVSMGENDNTVINYSSCLNIMDGRGYTIGQVGFTTGTGDFILVAACYNDAKPNNILSKYWPALVYYENQYMSTGMNQGDTSKIDALSGVPASAMQFSKDVAAAAADPDGIFDRCQDYVGDSLNMSSAIAHAQKRGFQGILTLGFLYDTELNFGETDDPGGLGGTATVMARADADYAKGGMSLPADFTGKSWEESRWLGFMILERAIEMSGDPTWQQDMDQDATWEAARRLHTAANNTPESGTDLTMAFDISSAYKAGFSGIGAACWADPPLHSTLDTTSTIFLIGLDKSASATDESTWKAAATRPPAKYAACPANPTP